jgi:ferredoxin
MTYMIVVEKCIGCGSCVHFCEHGAIDYLDEICVIDSSKCDGSCGGKCVEYCPIDDTIVEVPQEIKQSK